MGVFESAASESDFKLLRRRVSLAAFSLPMESIAYAEEKYRRPMSISGQPVGNTALCGAQLGNLSDFSGLPSGVRVSLAAQLNKRCREEENTAK